MPITRSKPEDNTRSRDEDNVPARNVRGSRKKTRRTQSELLNRNKQQQTNDDNHNNKKQKAAVPEPISPARNQHEIQSQEAETSPPYLISENNQDNAAADHHADVIEWGASL